MEYMPKVLQAVAGEDFTLYLYFSDGSVRLLLAAAYALIYVLWGQSTLMIRVKLRAYV